MARPPMSSPRLSIASITTANTPVASRCAIAGRPAYDRRVPAPALLFLAGVLALLVLIPTRRLYLAGWRGWGLLGYFAVVWAMGLLVAELRGPARFLVPMLVIAYLAPFVTARAGFARLLRPGDVVDDADRDDERRPPPRDVTPPDQPR